MENEFNYYNPEGSDLRKAQLKMIEILDEIVTIFNRHNIKYWLDGGTFLGAFRHQGFIPWDDDLDIDISSKDFQKAIMLLSKELPSNLIVQTKSNTPLYTDSHIKIRDKYSIIYDSYSDKFKYRGIFVDIFPAKSTNLKLQIYINKLSEYKIFHKKKKTIKGYLNFLFLKGYILLLEIVKYLSLKNAFVTIGFEKYVYPNILIDKISKINFEGKYYSCVSNAEIYLRIHYGEFMIIPNKEDRISHSTKIEFINN
jgi:lipopolysaccharide cholinephosphotransferase